MSLGVTVKSAKKLPNVERFRDKSDPLAILTFQDEKKKTKVIKDNLDPEWNQSFTFTLSTALGSRDVLEVKVYDYERIGFNRLLGEVNIYLGDVARYGSTDRSYILNRKDGSQSEAKIHIAMTYNAPGGVSGGGGDSKASADLKEEAALLDISDTEDVTNEARPGERLTGKGGKISAATEEIHRREQQKRTTRAKLPERLIDFQVRFHIIEAKKLVGGNLQPSVKVHCGKDVEQTSTQKGSNNPFWDEMLYFNFKELPKEMLNKTCEIKVLNTKYAVKHSLIGSFKFDLGLVYDEPDHDFIHKWLLLTDPHDSSGGSKGYLKISVLILGPGDEPKPSPPSISSDNVDIEANLLRPAGVSLQTGTMTIKIYRAEDLPQMDPGYFEGFKKLFGRAAYKELVDPYAVVAFAGHKGKTDVIWNNMTPKWNHQVNLGVRYPSMCDQVKLYMKDKDKIGKDDYIGTTYINLSEISAPGENGFLPTFGPVFVNMYGSPREFTDLPDKYEYLNKGRLPGVSYRGRIMIELGMEIGKLPTDRNEKIKLVDQRKLTPYLNRCNYKLTVVFDSATMIHPKNSSIEFEVSIGNYGNKLDKYVSASSSTTQPTNPAYDGCKYHYLPWLKTKPCVTVDCSWEDNTYRIESLNILLHMAEQLEKGIKQVNDIIQMDVNNLTEAGATLLNTVEQLKENLEQPMPVLPKQGCTKLDVNLRNHRMVELNCLLDEVRELLNHRITSPDITTNLNKCEDYHHRLLNLCVEPQNSIPDVVIWMLAANKRVASTRIPSHKLMYSGIAKASGKHCGKMQTIFLTPPAVEKEGELKNRKDRAQLRLQIWLGLAKDHSKWRDHSNDGKVVVYAEMYENQACVFGKWGTIGLLRPKFSDARGKRKLKKNYFVEPEGWHWEGDWFVNPQLSVEFDVDEGRTEYQEEIYEHQIRVLPFTRFGKHESYWTNLHGDRLTKNDGNYLSKYEEFVCPAGWEWMPNDWQVDKDGVVDEDNAVDVNEGTDQDGWQYCIEAGLGGWVASERSIHMCRRRRWVRTRRRMDISKIDQKKKAKHTKEDEYGWEYARLHHLSYHATERTFDLARRRRLHRKLINTDPSKPPIFYLTDKVKEKTIKEKILPKDEEEEDDDSTLAPRMFLTYSDDEVHTYQLRAYIFQARDLHGLDQSGLSDPYGILSFNCYSARTIIVKDTVSPTWDQTLWIENIKLFGDPEIVRQSPPMVYIEFFDKDTIGTHEFLGFMKIMPTVRLKAETPQPRLDWYPIIRYTKPAGELLAAFELILESGVPNILPLPKSKDKKYYSVPPGIRPVLQRTKIEVLCWGVRDMKKFQFQSVTSPSVEIQCEKNACRTEAIKDASDNPNFPTPTPIVFDMPLPKEELYAPPLIIRVYEKRAFGREPLIGTHVISRLNTYRADPTPKKPAVVVESFGGAGTQSDYLQKTKELAIESKTLDGDHDPDNKKECRFDWWSKYHASGIDDSKKQQEYITAGYDLLTIYDKEVERMFGLFEDFTITFPLYRGKGARNSNKDDSQICGYLKGDIKVYPVSPDGPEPEPILSAHSLPSTSPTECIVRVYVVKAIDLQPRDTNGKSDPYLKLKIGKTKIKDKEGCIPNTLNPVFGKMYELPANIPIDRTLEITVMDRDVLSDDLIGKTTIDLENRYLTKHMAHCGLPQSFHKSGPNKWHHYQFPTEILREICKKRGYDYPKFHSATQCTFNYKLYDIERIEKEAKKKHPEEVKIGEPEQRLALYILNEMDLVPEHVERRHLHNPAYPELHQGTLEMWVEIFPKSFSPLPEPVDISPRKTEKYELRIVVWNTVNVDLQETSYVTGEDMSDIYVKGWLRGMDETQKTDVHYRSMDGEGNFNWRFVFPFEYIPSEQVMVVTKKDHFWSRHKTVKTLKPKLTVQVWDNDKFSPDDFLGTMDIDLLSMPEGALTAWGCDLSIFPDPGDPDHECNSKIVSLFQKKRMKGFWPFYNEKTGQRKLTGKLEMEIEILTEEEVQLRPAGKARDDPNMNPHLDKPHRPPTSFLWFTSPLKSLRYIIWRHYKWYIIFAFMLLLFIILLAVWLYSAPKMFMEWMTDKILP